MNLNPIAAIKGFLNYIATTDKSTWYKTPYYALLEKIMSIVTRINWCSMRSLFNHGVYWSLTENDHDFLRKALTKDYYIVCTARKCHLTTFIIRAVSSLRGSSAPYYSHVLMNVEGDEPVLDSDFKLIEATGKGVHYSTFMQVFDCDSVALLKPKNMTLEDWTTALDEARKQNGKPYDNLFDLMDETHLSCVELVRDALLKVPGYAEKFPHFEAMISKERNLTPQMYYDCPDFEIVWEVKR
jgi:hypothetical protein